MNRNRLLRDLAACTLALSLGAAAPTVLAASTENMPPENGYPAYGPGMMGGYGPGMMGGYGGGYGPGMMHGYSGYGPGMMGGYGGGYGPGMMGGYGGGYGPGMMGGYGGGYGPGMMGGYGGGYGAGMMHGWGGGYGPGMMGGYGPGMMRGYGGYGPGMMRGYGGYGPGMMGGWGGYGPYGGADLSEHQRDEIQKIWSETRQKNWDLMRRIQQERYKLGAAGPEARQDDKEIQKTYKAIGKLRQQMYDNASHAHKQIEDILSKGK